MDNIEILKIDSNIYNVKLILTKHNIDRINTNIEYKYIKDNGIIRRTNHFKNILISNFDDKDLTNFYNNINYLEVMIDKDYKGHRNSYDGTNNIIYLEGKNKDAIYHISYV